MVQKSRDFEIPQSAGILLGCFFFGMSTLTRSTGVLLSIIIAYFMGNKILIKSDRFCGLFKTIFFTIICVFIMVTPLFIIIYWRPYLLHCTKRLERDWQGEYPEWCTDALPSVYTYI